MRAKDLAPWPALLLLFFGAFSVTGIAEEQGTKLPTFTWMDNLNIIVLFPNGVEDTIKLWEVEKFGNLAVPCLYEGILKADNSSTVAVSGCQHDEVINLVMYTKYLPQNTMFNIINGTVEEVEKIYFSKNNAKVTKRKRRRLIKRGAYLDDEDYDEVAFDSGSEPEPPAFLSLEVKLAFEETLLTEKVTEVAAREYIARVFTLGKQHLRHPTLGSVINLKAQGPIRRIIGKSWVPTTSNLTESKDYKEPETRPITFFCYNQDRDNDTGISYIRKACDEKKGVAIVAARKDINKAAQTYAHECGHWLGLPHDAEEDEIKGTSCEGTGLMSRPEGRPEQWSDCNKRRFRRWYNRNSNKLSYCLKDDEGAVIHEEDAHGDWDFDHSSGGVTLQIKYKDPANMWKGGHAHFELQDLKALIPAARSRNVTFDITFDGGVAKMDGIFNLKIEYSLQHTFEEKGIFEFNREHFGNHWISAISNKKNGGANGMRIFPEMEFHEKNDGSTMSTATYNSDIFKNVKLVIKRDPGKKLDGTLGGNFFGKDVKITLHGTRNSATNKLDGTLAIEFAGKRTVAIEFAGKRTEWIKFAGSLKFTYGPKNCQFSWVVDRTNGVKVHMKANTGQGDIMIKYQRNANWKLIKFSLNLFGTEMVALQIRRDIKSVWDRKTVIVYKGALFAKQGYQGKITLQVQEVDAHTKRFSVIADTKHEKEVLKYINIISHNKQANGGHQELTAIMKANLDLKDSSQVHKFLCKDPNSIHCFNHREADISLILNIDEPWHMLFLAKLNKDGNNVVDAKIDTKSHNLQTPYVFHLKAPRLLPNTFDAVVKRVGHTVVGTVKLDNAKVFEVILNSPDGKSPYEVEFAVNDVNYKISVVHEDKNGDGEEDYLDVKVFKNGPKVFDFEIDRRSWPHTFKVEYSALFAFMTGTAGKIDGTHDRGKLHIHFHPGKGKDIEIDLERTHKDAAGKHERHFKGMIQRNNEVYYEYDSIVHFGVNPSQFELDANSKMTVNSKLLLHQLVCSPMMSGLSFLCFNHRTMEAKFRADKTKPYKMNVHTKVDKDGAEVFRIDMQTQTSPYKLTFNWPRMRAIVAPYRNGPLEITANHIPGTSLAITSNIRGFKQFSVVKMPNGHRKITLNNRELVTVYFQKSRRTITQSTTLPDGQALTTTFKWGNDNNWLNNHIELDLDGTERKLDSKFEWNFEAAAGTCKLDAVGHNNRWGHYNIHRTVKYAKNGGVWTFDVDGTALWKGNNVKTDVFIQLDTSKVGNGKLDAITAKLIKVVDG